MLLTLSEAPSGWDTNKDFKLHAKVSKCLPVHLEPVGQVIALSNTGNIMSIT